MNNQTILIAIIALLLGGIGGYVISEKNQPEVEEWSCDHMGDEKGMDMPSMDNMMGMDHSAMMVSSEREFIEGMIPHHQEAVDTANEVIARGGTTPEVKELVENIVVAQEAEIAEMKAWYLTWYGEEYKDVGSYQPMMRELETLSGEEIDKRFLEDMIGHHMGAIMMARSVQPYIEHQEITDLTKAIVETQSDEIDLMNRLLKEL